MSFYYFTPGAVNYCNKHVCVSVCPIAYLNKSSAVAEMGDRARAKWAEKWGRLHCRFP